jgi:hypothetical protein
MPERIKASFNLTSQDVERLKFLASEQEITHTEALRRAIATEEFLYRNVLGGSTLLLKSPDNQIRELVVHYRIPVTAK